VDDHDVMAFLHTGVRQSGRVSVERQEIAPGDYRIRTRRVIQDPDGRQREFRTESQVVPHPTYPGYSAFDQLWSRELRAVGGAGLESLRQQLTSSNPLMSGAFPDLAFEAETTERGLIQLSLGTVEGNSVMAFLYTGVQQAGRVVIQRQEVAPGDYRIRTTRQIGDKIISTESVIVPHPSYGAQGYFTFEQRSNRTRTRKPNAEVIGPEPIEEIDEVGDAEVEPRLDEGLESLRQQLTSANPHAPGVFPDLVTEIEVSEYGRRSLFLGTVDGHEIIAALSTGIPRAGRVTVERREVAAGDYRIRTRRIVQEPDHRRREFHTESRIVPHPSYPGYSICDQLWSRELLVIGGAELEDIRQQITSPNPFAPGAFPDLAFEAETNDKGQIRFTLGKVGNKNVVIVLSTGVKTAGNVLIQRREVAPGDYRIRTMRQLGEEVLSTESVIVPHPTYGAQGYYTFNQPGRPQRSEQAWIRTLWGVASLNKDRMAYERFLIERGLVRLRAEQVRSGTGLSFHAHERLMDRLAEVLPALGPRVATVEVAALASGPSMLAAAWRSAAQQNPADQELLNRLRITEVDHALVMLQAGRDIQRTHLGGHPTTVQVVGSLTALPLLAGQYDVTVLGFAIEQLSESGRLQALLEAHRITKPGGLLILLEPRGTYHRDLQRLEDIEEVLVYPQPGDPADLVIFRKTNTTLDIATLAPLFEVTRERTAVGQRRPPHHAEIPADADPYRDLPRLGSAFSVGPTPSWPWERGVGVSQRLQHAFTDSLNRLFEETPESLAAKLSRFVDEGSRLIIFSNSSEGGFLLKKSVSS
jgi:hypothetical protein